MCAAPSLPKNMSVRVAQNDASRLRVFRFRHSVLVDELHGNPPGRDDTNKVVREALDDTSTILYLGSEHEIMGTVRLSYALVTPVPPNLYEAYQLKSFDDYADSDLSMTSAWAVAERWRNSPALAILLGAAFKMCLERNILFDFSNCAPAQLNLFQRLGYRRYGPNFSDDSGLRVPLVMLLNDIRHLKLVKSPLFRIASNFESSSDTAVWFSRRFPESNRATAIASMSEDEFWVYMTQQLHEDPSASIPLLKGMSDNDAKRFIAASTVISCEAEETVINQGELGNEMFVILSGEVEVRAGGVDGRPIANFGRGDIFGEVAYVSEVERSATVVALTGIEILVVTQSMLKKMTKTMPEAACQVLFNLSVILCDRLSHSTETLTIENDVTDSVDVGGNGEDRAPHAVT
ncbi:MAG: cyclic nucleotide-binding domain-containing protein [Rhodospirillaceae bacterium]|nr:cyclic nucleotide-binding domain-containing protein [Rhodospirillaceae bacterium]